jgi:hypothetical protein
MFKQLLGDTPRDAAENVLNKISRYNVKVGTPK